ncbi:MAG: hypothetical protein P8N52_02360, partial [Crocinitomicaceae bacterium]|nr:hypothetical protein [Crocinitomicaceae bacterium]
MVDFFSVDTSWETVDTRVVVPVFVTLVFFILYWFTAQSKKIKTAFFKQNTADQGSIKHIFFTKVFGFISMG